MNFQNQVDFLPTMLDDLPVPDDLDPDVMRSEIMLECGLLTPLYSEPEIMQSAIRQWFRSRQWTFEKLIDIIKAKYSPIENTDRYEEMSRDETEKLDKTRDRDATAEDSVEVTNGTEDKVAAYNTDSYSESSQRTGTDSTEATREESENEREKHDRGLNEKLVRHVHGNIGVTSNVQLINEQLGLLEEFNIYKWIAMNMRHSLFLEVW